MIAEPEPDVDLLALDEALKKLETLDPPKLSSSNYGTSVA